MKKVKIISGWSNPGGSTLHHIGLTNLFNDKGYDCTFYGPHEYHLKKCKSGTLADLRIEKDDIIISHFLPFSSRPDCKQHILSLHETSLFPINKIKLDGVYDGIQYVSNHQRRWHNVLFNHVIIPPRVDRIAWSKPSELVVGVIGSIDQHKQPHIAVMDALEEGYKVKLFGKITDRAYYEKALKPLLCDKVSLSYAENKTQMYNQVQEVYHSSKYETYGLVEAECKLAGIPFRGSKFDPVIWSDEEIFERWNEILI